MSTYLGFDISTKTVGIALISDDDGYKIKHIEYYEPPHDQSLFHMLTETKKHIISVLRKFKYDKVIIEDIAEYMGGASTSKTIIALATINRTVGLTVYEETGQVPILMNVNTVRSIIRPKEYIGKVVKEDVPDIVANIMGIPKDKSPIIVMERVRKVDRIAMCSYDMADACAVVLAYIMEQNNPRPVKPKKVKKRKKKNDTTGSI